MVRRRIEIKAIEDKAKRHTTFTKRRKGLVKKAMDLCDRCGAEAAVIAFSKAGNIFAFGHPCVELLVSRYLTDTSDSSLLNSEAETSGSDGGGIVVEVTEAMRRIGEAVESGRWDAAIGDLGLDELDEIAAEVARIKAALATRAAEGENIGGGLFSGGDSVSNR